MRISELSRRSGVPVASIKFYLREGLLPPGELTAQTQAQYGEQHVSRLAVIRALVGAAGLPVASARQLLDLLEQPQPDVLDLFAQTQTLLTPVTGEVDVSAVREQLGDWGWSANEKCNAPLRALAEALAAADTAGFTIPPGVLDVYARAMHEVAEIEIANTPTTSLADAVRYTVLGTVLMESVLLALRRLAEADVAVRRGYTFDRPTPDRSEHP